MTTDPIADILIRIKNAYLARHKTVEIPYSKMKVKIGKILVKKDYLESLKIQKIKDSKFKKIVCKLKYQAGEPAFENIKRVSKPGRRIYVHWNKIPRTLSGYGTTIVSTSKGIMVDKEARKKKLGGEVICKVW